MNESGLIVRHGSLSIRNIAFSTFLFLLVNLWIDHNGVLADHLRHDVDIYEEIQGDQQFYRYADDYNAYDLYSSDVVSSWSDSMDLKRTLRTSNPSSTSNYYSYLDSYYNSYYDNNNNDNLYYDSDDYPPPLPPSIPFSGEEVGKRNLRDNKAHIPGGYLKYDRSIGLCCIIPQNSCNPQNVVCTLEFNPVCGCDHHTYDNPCVARYNYCNRYSTPGPCN